MKKLFILLLIILFVWIIKLSYDVFKISANQTELNRVITRLEKTNSNLNDQLAALQRRGYAQSNDSVVVAKKEIINQSDIHPNELIKQQLTLIEFALNQHEYSYALDQLIQLNQKIESYPLSPALKESLYQVIEKDSKIIIQFVESKSEQTQKINQIMQQLNAELKREIAHPNLKPAKSEKDYFWTKWISIDSSESQNQALMQRSIILKEVQLRLVASRDALVIGQYIEYKQEINEIIALLNQLPDQEAKNLVKQLENIKGLAVISVPTLSIRTLLG